MKIVTLLTLATVALTKHHHRHKPTETIVKDIEIDDNNNFDEIINIS